MKKLLLFLILGIFPSLALAGTDPVADICYEEPEYAVDGIGICMDYGAFKGGMNCRTTIPLKSLSDDPLTDVQTVLDLTGINGSAFDTCGIDDIEGNCVENSTIGFGPGNALTDGVIYTPYPDYSNGYGEVHRIFVRSRFEGALFQKENLYVTYKKNGIVYDGEVLPCDAIPPKDESVPTDAVIDETIECDTFADMFQTHNNCNGTVGGTISFNNAGQTLDNSVNIILENPDNILGTCLVTTATWVKDQFETCGEKGDCEQSGTNAQALQINYSNPPATTSVASHPTGSTNDVVLDGTGNVLQEATYNEVTTSYHTNVEATFKVTNRLDINSLKMTTDNTFNFESSDDNPYNINIGYLGIENNGVSNTITTDQATKNIKINTFELESNTNISLEASQTIQMEKFSVGRGSNIVLKAPYVNINDFKTTSSGSGDSIVTIYADYIDFGNTTFGQTVQFEIYPYTPGKKVLFRTGDFTETSSSKAVVSSGSYYINGIWTLPGTSDIAAFKARDKDQYVNLYINSDLTIGNNPGINALGNNGKYDQDLPAANFRLFINGDLDTGGGGTTINATIYVEGDATFGNPTYIKGAVSANTSINIGQGQFQYDQSIIDAGYGSCSTGGGVVYASGPFDAWDSTRNITDRNISTKIVNRPFSLVIASLNETGDSTETKEGIDIEYRLFDLATSTAVSSWQRYYASTALDGESATKIFNSTDSAYRDVRVQFKICITQADDGSGTVLHPLEYCTLMNIEPNTSYYSTDNFAIRPKNFSITDASSSIKAGVGYLYSIKAEKELIGESLNYTVSNLTYNLNIDTTKYMPDDSINNALHGTAAIHSYSFIDGISSDMNISYDDVGKVTLHIEDQQWAIVDADDTPNNCNNDPLSIGRYICGDTNATFIPDHFSLNNVQVYNDHNGTYTYISNDLNMSASIALSIEAKNYQNAITQNFDSASWENPVSLDLNVTNTSRPSLVKNTVSEQSLGFTLGSYTISWDEPNISKNMLFNFVRTVDNAINPFVLQGSEVDVNITSDYSGIQITGNATATQNTKFLYAKAHAPKTITNTTPVDVPIYYEIFCYGNGCDKTLLPNGTNSKNSDDPRWWINENHTSQDGDAGTISQKGSSIIVVETSPTGNAPDKVTLSYDGSKGYPYKATMQMVPKSWLIYNKYDSSATTNEFQVEFFNADGDWAGKYETDSSTDKNASNRTSRRVIW